MLELHEAVCARYPRDILKEEIGLFEVVSPTGDIYRVCCRAGAVLKADHSHYVKELEREDEVWLVMKVSANPDADWDSVMRNAHIAFAGLGAMQKAPTPANRSAA